MFKGCFTLVWPVTLMMVVIAVLSGLNPFTGRFTSDRSYLDKEYSFEMPALLAYGLVVIACIFVLRIHQLGLRNGHGGVFHNLITLGLFTGILAIIAKVFGGG